MATVKTLLPKKQAEESRIRIAAYCRVSTDSADQKDSFDAQVEYYTRYIGENPNWALADIYADQGISGTSMAKRDEFNRMIADCQRGKIDRIITKSVSRFARNTVDCLDTVRKLSAIGISVLFQKEQIDTAKMSSEFLLALAGVQAQDESVSISQNVKWGCKTRMKHGELVGSAAYGYVLKNGTLVINEEEAEVIRTIFRLYLSGMGKPKIADYLNENNIPYHGSVENWSLNTIDYILQNERYIGDALLQKTFTSDRLPFKRHRNKGNCPMYYVSFSHPPIISREDFEAVRELQKKRNTTITRTHRKLSKLLVCNDCNHSYRRIEINAKNYWKCPCRSRGERNCDSILLYEEDVCAALIRMVNILHQNYNYIIKPAIAAKEHLISKENGVDHKVYEIDKLIAEVNNQIHLLTQLQVQGILDPTDFTLESSTLTNKVNKLRAERMRLLRQSQLNDELIKMEEIADIIYSIDQELATFDEDLIRSIVEKIIVKSSVEIEIHLFGGLVITEYLPKRKERNHQE